MRVISLLLLSLISAGATAKNLNTDRLMSKDTNKDGRLSREELGEPFWQRAAGQDANGDGFLDAMELQALLTEAVEERRNRRAPVVPISRFRCANSRPRTARPCATVCSFRWSDPILPCHWCSVFMVPAAIPMRRISLPLQNGRSSIPASSWHRRVTANRRGGRRVRFAVAKATS